MKEPMYQSVRLATGVLLIACLLNSAHAQDVPKEPLATSPPRISEVDKDDLVLMNVAAKGRVVELLANELARTEIIRALLVEYARECVENVTLLERHCLDCMIDRCRDRMSACDIQPSAPLEEILTHDPAPIKGVQFLSMSPADVDQDLREFAHNARTDILSGIPEALRPESESIMHSEVDQSLHDLNDNMNTDKALKTISMHVQKVADNVHVIPDIGEKVGTLIVENEDHAVNVAELLAERLKASRPFIQSINHNGGRILEQMPEVIDTVGEKVDEFKAKIGGVFSRVMGTFSRVMDMPDTHVVNGNMLGPMPSMPPMPNMNHDPRILNPNIDPRTMHGPQFNPGAGPRGLPPQGGSFIGNVVQGGRDLLGRGKALISKARGDVSNSLPGQPIQGQGIQVLPSGAAHQVQFIGQPGGQFQNGQFQNMQNQQLQQQQQFRNQQQQQQQLMQGQQVGGGQFGNAVPQQQFQNNPSVIGQKKRRRRKRYDEPACDKLDLDPDMYCRTYESQCHNCTLEKRLRFEVCGEGVERARDEIKRMDDSVKSYLQVYNEYIAKNQLILKVEINDSNRLHKTNSHYDSYVTAKVGPSIFRYKTKMILNIRDVKTTGVQLGDELWEKLWENGVLEEAPQVEIPGRKENIMGQNHIAEVHSSHPHADAHAHSSGSVRISYLSSFVVSVLSFFFIAVF